MGGNRAYEIRSRVIPFNVLLGSVERWQLYMGLL